MVRINDLPAPESPQRSRTNQPQRSEGSDQSSASVPSSDSLEISDAAKQSQDDQARLTEEARNIPDVREDKIADVRARLESGEFDSEEVRRVIADRLLDQFGL